MTFLDYFLNLYYFRPLKIVKKGILTFQMYATVRWKHDRPHNVYIFLLKID